jgi:hypothetical protein
MSLDNDAIKNSSSMNGKTNTAANGQPSIAPTPNQKIPCAVRTPPRQSKNAAVPSMVVYMAKVEGKYAVAAWNMPELVVIMSIKYTAIRGLIVREMTPNSRVSQPAHTSPRTSLRK